MRKREESGEKNLRTFPSQLHTQSQGWRCEARHEEAEALRVPV